MKKVHLISLGCPKNLVDSEIIAGTLLQDGYEICNDADAADTVVINTCGFIEESKKESIQRIIEMGDLKAQGKINRLVVAGCLTQRYKNDLVDDLPEADLFVGSGEFQNISQILKSHDQGSKQKTFFNLPTYLQQENTPRVNSQPGFRAYLKISEGCMKRCAFCAIPLIRGNLQSRTIRQIVNEAKLLALGGVKELIVISHDFTDYGWDLRRKDSTSNDSPIELLKALGEVDGIEWIRLLYLYPDGITQEMLELFQSNKKFCRYFDMPLQHISDSVLKAMNRKMTKAEITGVLDMIRSHLPDAIIRTQFIVGFPGETEKDFEELLQFVSDQKFDRVGSFQYSIEENTPGAKMPNQVSDELKAFRQDALMSVQQKISLEKNRSIIGRTFYAMVEGLSTETDLLLQARTQGQAPEIDGVTLINEGEADVGDIVQIEVVGAMEYDLIARIIPHG